MAGVEFVTAKGYIDSKRIAIAGGLIAAWAIGHTGRFTRAIARQPIVDWATDVAIAPDGARRAANWMGAMPWEDPDQYVKRSPIFSVGNFQTPTLVIGEAPESRQLYWALRQRSVETALMRTGGTPADQVAELEAMLAWLEHAPGSRP
jgi:acylaminoacyl-peptidase